jgi:ferric-dicitrate binding protein FerR (iron transport regulator)
MRKDQSNIDYFQLIPKYLSGNASDLEVKLLEDWVLVSPDNKTHFQAFRKAWILSGIKNKNEKIDVNKEWEFFNQKISNSENKSLPQLEIRPKYTFGYLTRIAAAIIFIIAASFGVFQYLKKDNFTNIVSEDTIVKKLLPDNSYISLNQYSLISFASMKNKKYRRVKLIGDAFFEVKRDITQAFIVSTENIEVEVLGTSFYVDARKGQSQIQVIVKSGSVAVSVKNKKVILSTNEVGIYDKKTKTLTKKQNENINYLSWKTDLLVFEKSNLKDVVYDLNRRFHSNISVGNPKLDSCEITATFDKKSLSAIINIIEKTLNINTTKKEEEYIFIGIDCE